MKTIKISKSDFDVDNQSSIFSFNTFLQKITESFEVVFDFPITKIPSFLFCNTNLVKITLPQSLTQIDKSAFESTNLQEIILPSSIKEINDFAFFESSLKEITIPVSVTKIGTWAFNSCTNLDSITLSPSLLYLNTNIIDCCSALHQIIIPLSKKDFLSNIEGAHVFYDRYKDLISFEDKSLDTLLIKNNSLEQIITNLEPEH